MYIYCNSCMCSMSLSLYQGCITGSLVGLSVPFWIIMGSYTLPKVPRHLDFPTQNCTLDSITTLSPVNVSMTTAAPVQEL